MSPGNKVDPSYAESVMLKAGLKPLEPFKSSTTKWKCLHLACGEIVSPQYHQIQRGQGGCLSCGRKRTAESQRIPEDDAIKMMMGANLKPKTKFPGAKIPWKCECLKCKKIVSPTYSAIKNGQGGCKYCAKKFIDSKDAVIIMKKGGFKPLEPYNSAGKPWRSKCIKCGLVSTPTFANVQNGSGCFDCKNKEGGLKNRIPQEEAILLMLNVGMQPLELYTGSHNPWKSQCIVCNKITSPMLGNIIQGHSGCRYCSGHKVDPVDAIKKMKKAGLEPLEKYKGADKLWKCRHLICGQIVYPTYSSIRSGQGGCRKCGQIKTAHSHRVSEADAIKVMAAANLKPMAPYIKSDNPWKCKCMICRKIVYPAYSNIKAGNKGCLYCIGKKVDSEDAVALMRINGFEPLVPYVNSKKKWKSRHLKCGNIVYPQYNTIQNRQTGCSACAEYGITYTEPAYLYIMQHDEHSSIKIGISNNEATPNRVRSHQLQGWKHFKSFNFATGQIAEDIENQLLSWLRNDKHLGIHLSKDLMKQGGHTETVDAMEITVIEIEHKTRELIKFKRKNP